MRTHNIDIDRKVRLGLS
jgi:hypothetical protein